MKIHVNLRPLTLDVTCQLVGVLSYQLLGSDGSCLPFPTQIHQSMIVGNLQTAAPGQQRLLQLVTMKCAAKHVITHAHKRLSNASACFGTDLSLYLSPD